MKIAKDVLKNIKLYDTIIIHRHTLPDGDAHGSQLAMKELINLNWPDKKVYAVGEKTEYLNFLGNMNEITDEQYSNALVIVTDTANIPRIDDQRYNYGKMVIKIDHHPNNEPYGDVQWVDTTYPATCEMLGEFIFDNHLKLDNKIAECLLIGIITDTTRFMLRNISNRTFLITSKLLSYYDKNITNIYDNLEAKSNNEAKFLSYCYSKYKISGKGIINLSISTKILSQFKLSADKAAYHVNIFSNIIGHKIWIVGIEYPNKIIRCELRTNDNNMQVNKIAAKFNGGGHSTSAGCKISSWNKFQEVVIALETLL